MKPIIILSLEPFAKYKSYIGVIAEHEDTNLIILNTGHRQFNLKPSQLKSITIEEINRALNRNEELKELAYENNLIELHTQDAQSYMSYVSSYN
jgi:hypothetical protein